MRAALSSASPVPTATHTLQPGGNTTNGTALAMNAAQHWEPRLLQYKQTWRICGGLAGNEAAAQYGPCDVIDAAPPPICTAHAAYVRFALRERS